MSKPGACTESLPQVEATRLGPGRRCEGQGQVQGGKTSLSGDGANAER